MKRSRSYAPKPRSRSYPKKTKTTKSTYRAPASSVVLRKNSPRSGPSNRAWCEFIYNEQLIALNPAAGIAGSYIMSLTSLYDPNVSGVGHQPTNFDQLMLIYEEFVVYEAEYIAKFYSTNNASYRIGCTVSDVASPSISDSRVFIENGQTQWDMMMDATGNNQSRVVTMKGTVDIAKAHGITRKALLGDAQYFGTSGNSPTDNITLTLWASEIADGDVTSCYCDLEIRYKAYLMGSKLNSLS